MRIFVIGARGFPNVQGGIEKYCEELYRRLTKRRDIEITALVIRGYYKKQIEQWEGVNFIYIKALKSKNMEKLYYGLKAALVTIIKRPDIVHFHGLSCGLFVPMVKLFGVKVVLTFQSRDYLYPKWGRLAKKVWKLSEKAALISDRIIAVSQAHTEYIQQFTDRVMRVPNGVEIHHLDISREEEEHYLNKHGLERKGYIFFAGRFTPEKAIEDLISAYERLNNSAIKLVLAGDADHEDSYSGMIKKRAYKIQNIVLTGFITGNELQTLFSNAKLFVLPSRFEGLPHVLLEAISFGVEVLASDIEANLQIDLDRNNFFEQGNIEDLKTKIVRFLETDMQEEEILRRRRMIEKEYNWNDISEKIYKQYQALMLS